MSSCFCGISSWQQILRQINNHILEWQILPFWQLHHQLAWCWCSFKTNFVGSLVSSALEKLLIRNMLLICSEIWTSLVLDCRKVGGFILVKKNQCHQVFVEFLLDNKFYVKSIITFWKGKYFHFDNFIISLLDADSKQTLLDIWFHPLLKNCCQGPCFWYVVKYEPL